MPDLSAPVQAVSAAVQNLVLVSEVCYGIKLRHFLVEIVLINKLSTASLYRGCRGCQAADMAVASSIIGGGPHDHILENLRCNIFVNTTIDQK